ncbi:MAG: ThuA domain-containing protein [Gammaproteobacteria bacterium TMED134]|nr:MAG: ThuA domain-containing protein [Gammaproteobacteria bacterium TMED134]RPG47560.1 MAG: ThuA domain-containing protein [Gammaproteobacteria bacterium TMED134]RZO70819.1 MAG: ThuA domain-containing protein [OM182 bacterium]|tara:strand:- start:6801 stop:7676 length:876 start_codon:yes stop_codon:yes gene_type:complete
MTGRWRVWLALALIVTLVVGVYQYRVLLMVLWQQPQLLQAPQLDNEALSPPENLGEIAILSFSKTNAFRHQESIPASIKMLDQLGQKNGWRFFHTENGGYFNTSALAQFDLIILNHKSGTVWNDEQRQALKDYVETGGTLIAQHAAGGDRSYEWDWYLQEALRAQFVDHPMERHIQVASLLVEDSQHPATSHLPKIWQRADEWYNFVESPRALTHVLISIDESTYDPESSPMGADHPLVWWHPVGAGRVFYSALGHTPATYSEPAFRQFMEGAIRWGLDSPDALRGEEHEF